MIHIMAVLFLRLSQPSFSEWGGAGLEHHRHTVPAGSLLLGEPPALWSLGPEWHCFHKVLVSCVCLPVDILKTASLPIAEYIFCVFFFTDSESFSMYLVTAASFLL